MRKILSIALLFVLLFSLSACQDKKLVDDNINVQFFADVQNGTNPVDIVGLNEGDLVTLPAEPFKDGFEFDGWYLDYQLTQEWDFDTDTVGDHTILLFAKWIPAIYNLTLIVYDDVEFVDTGISPTFSPGDNIVLPSATREGFTFVSWYDYPYKDEFGEVTTKPGDSGYQTVPTDGYDDLTLYAHWETIRVRIQFVTNFPLDDQGPDNPSTMYLDYGTIIDFPEFDDTLGYTFLGWNTRADGEGTFYVDGDPFIRTAKLKLFGIWELIE